MNKPEWTFGDKPSEPGTYLIASISIEDLQKGGIFIEITSAFFSNEGVWEPLHSANKSYDFGCEKIIAFAETWCFNSFDEFVMFTKGIECDE